MRNSSAKFAFFLIAVILIGATACGPSTAPEHMAAAEQFRSRGEFRTAIIYVKKAVALDPSDPAKHEFLGELYSLAEMPESALRSYEKAKSYGADSIELSRATLNAKLGAGRYREVIDEIQELKDIDPELEFLLADAYFENDDLDQAREIFQAAERPEKYERLGWIERLSGRYESALSAFQMALESSPDGDTVHELGRMQRFFDPIKSIDYFRRLAGMPDFEYDAMRELVRTYQLIGDKQELATHLAALAKNHSQRSGTKFLKSVDDLNAGNFEAAAESLRILYYSSHRDHFLLPLAFAEYGRHDFVAAKQYAERVLSYDPLNASAAKLLIAINVNEGEQVVVTPEIKRLANLTNDPQLLRMIGEFALREGETDLALEVFARARRDLANSENSELTAYLNIRASPNRARLYLPVNFDASDGVFADNCFGLLAGSPNDSQITVATDNCGAAVPSFLLGLRSLNSFDLKGAAEKFREALKIDGSLIQARLLLAQLIDPRFSTAGFRHPGPLTETPYQFGDEPPGFELSTTDWRRIRSIYADLADRGNYDALVVQAEFVYANGKTESAVDLLDQLTSEYPDRYRAFQVLAAIKMKESTAKAWIREVRSSSSPALWASWEMRIIRAAIYEQANDLENASQVTRYLQDPIDLYPTMPAENRLHLAELQIRLDQNLLANENYALVASDASAAAALKNIANLRLSNSK